MGTDTPPPPPPPEPPDLNPHAASGGTSSNGLPWLNILENDMDLLIKDEQKHLAMTRNGCVCRRVVSPQLSYRDDHTVAKDTKAMVLRRELVVVLPAAHSRTSHKNNATTSDDALPVKQPPKPLDADSLTTDGETFSDKLSTCSVKGAGRLEAIMREKLTVGAILDACQKSSRVDLMDQAQLI